VYIVEAKGAGGQRGTLTTKDGESVQQGTVKYRNEIIANMKKKAKKTGDIEFRKTVKKWRPRQNKGIWNVSKSYKKTSDEKLVPIFKFQNISREKLHEQKNASRS